MTTKPSGVLWCPRAPFPLPSLAHPDSTAPAVALIPSSDLARLDRAGLAEALAPALARLHEVLPGDEAGEAIDAALATGRSLYSLGRSAEAIELARAALAQARRSPGSPRIYRALAACGILCADAFDVVSAIEFHAQALRLATQESEPVELAQAWNNIGLALNLAGSPAMATRAYARAIDAAQAVAGPCYVRFAACANRANTLLHLGAYDEG